MIETRIAYAIAEVVNDPIRTRWHIVGVIPGQDPQPVKVNGRGPGWSSLRRARAALDAILTSNDTFIGLCAPIRHAQPWDERNTA